MNLITVKTTLIQHHIPTWKLINAMNISHNTYYSYAHKGFKGIEDRLNKALKTLTRGDVKHE